jgi:hypothetical protein
LRNDAPAAGLPLAIIGNNDQGLALGTNAMFFSFYTPNLLRDATLDGEPWQMEIHKEGGYRIYARFLSLAPGQEVTVKLDLMGQLPAGGQYALDIGHQPVVQPDSLSARVELQRGWYLTDAEGEGVRSGTQELQSTQQQSGPQQIFATLKQREY